MEEAHVSLTKQQKTEINRAYKSKSGVQITLKRTRLTGSDRILINKANLKKLEAARKKDTDVSLLLSARAIQQGGIIPLIVGAIASSIPGLVEAAPTIASQFKDGTDKFIKLITGKGSEGEPDNVGASVGIDFVEHQTVEEIASEMRSISDARAEELGGSLQNFGSASGSSIQNFGSVAAPLGRGRPKRVYKKKEASQ